MGVREPRIPLRYLQIDPAASRHGCQDLSQVSKLDGKHGERPGTIERRKPMMPLSVK